jgi:hypothetical protein
MNGNTAKKKKEYFQSASAGSRGELQSNMDILQKTLGQAWRMQVLLACSLPYSQGHSLAWDGWTQC